MKVKHINRSKLISAIISGFLLTLSFPGIQWSFVAWFALVPLFWALQDLSSGDAFRIGLVAGFIHSVTLMYWVVFTMHTYGYLPWWLSIIILFLFAAYLALYPAVFSFLLIRFCKTPFGFVVAGPCLWVVLEYFRGVFLTGFPWALLGYSQFNNLHLIQISDIFGVYGVTFLIVAVNIIIFQLILHVSRGELNGVKTKAVKVFATCFAVVAMVILVWVYGHLKIASFDESADREQAVDIALIQGNIDQAHKWDPAFQIITTNRYRSLSLSVKDEKPDLVVWPETATPFYFFRSRELTDAVVETIIGTGTDFLIGSPSVRESELGFSHFNSAYLVGKDGNKMGTYDKVHLVPFGEYVPLKRWLPFLGKMVAQVGDFSRGKKGDALKWKDDHHIGVLICYEIIFPDLSRAAVKNGASLLANITNDAWFGKSSAPMQHFSMAVFRAVENKRALVRAANTGISGFIDPLGRVHGKTAIFEEAVSVKTLPLMDEATFYTRFGDLFVLICFFVVATIIGEPVVKEYNLFNPKGKQSV